MQDQLQHLHSTLRKHPPSGDSAAERVAETLMRAFRALQREPHLADAMVRALTFADRSVSPEVDTVSRQTTAIILDAMGLDHPTPQQLSAVRVIEHTWHSALITWLSGRASIAQVKIDIETVCRLIDLTAPDGPRPDAFPVRSGFRPDPVPGFPARPGSRFPARSSAAKRLCARRAHTAGTTAPRRSVRRARPRATPWLIIRVPVSRGADRNVSRAKGRQPVGGELEGAET